MAVVEATVEEIGVLAAVVGAAEVTGASVVVGAT